ncbi:MAG TPA: hypothetical protein VEM59_04795 [Acidimicrobiia bacterium]|jgi:hypothetical protein|nr:hypothetical protein [Acidimicrobiia bacterium]
MSVLVRIARTGLRRGLREGSRPWLLAGISAGALVLVRRALTEQPELVYQAELQPGERLEIRTIPAEAEQNAEPAQ